MYTQEAVHPGGVHPGGREYTQGWGGYTHGEVHPGGYTNGVGYTRGGEGGGTPRGGKQIKTAFLFFRHNSRDY